MKSSKKGISLIVLVITIIVMIILATAIILSLNSSNIVEKAKEAQKSSDAANIKQAATVAYAEYVLDVNEGKVASGTTAEQYVKAKLISQGIAEENLKTLMVTEKGKVFVFKIPEGFVASQVSTEDEVSEGLVIYEGTEPVTDANKATAQTTRNQYVWVPVEDEFERVNWQNETDFSTYYTEPYSYDTTITEANDLTGEWAEYAKMKASVAKYGGFYIARYEAGTTVAREEGEANGTTTLIPSQKNKAVYNCVGWGQSMTDVEGDVTDAESGENQGKGAVELARNIYPESSDKEVVSTLIYGVQWDAALKFISKTDAGYALDSTDKGNYTGTLANTGSNNAYAKNNIYDMAGNVDEWTMEAVGSSGRVIRGGNFCVGSGGSDDPASDRISDGPVYAYDYHGLRLALYIK